MANNMNDGETRAAGTDVSNLGDYNTMVVTTNDGNELKIHVYGR